MAVTGDLKFMVNVGGDFWREVEIGFRSQGNKLKKYLLIESDEVSGKGNWKKF